MPRFTVNPTPRADGRGWYANVTDPTTRRRRQLSWPGRTDADRFVAIVQRDGLPQALADYDRWKGTRGDRAAKADRDTRLTVLEVARKYIDSRDGESTQRAYETRYRMLERYAPLALMPAERVQVAHLLAYAEWLRTEPTNPRTGKPLTANTVYSDWTLPAQALNYAAEELHLITASPAKSIPKAKRVSQPTAAQSRKCATVITGAQFGAILEVANGERERLAYRALWATGMRLGEVTALMPADIALVGDLAAITVERTWAQRRAVRGSGLAFYLGPTKGRNTRVVYVSRALGEELLAVPVHPTSGVLDLRRHEVAREWGKARKRAARKGLAPVTVRLHDLRHSHITHLLAAGANPLEVSRRAGHASVAFTMDRYGHVLDEAAQALARMVA